VAAWCVAVRLPGYRDAHERAIRESLGCQARLERVSTPRPNLLLYEGLELADLDSGRLLARLPVVEIETKGSAASIRLSHPAIVSGAHLDALYRLVVRQLRDGRAWQRIDLAAQNVTLQLADGDRTLTDVGGAVERTAAESRLSATFRLAVADTTPGEQRSAPSELHVSRSHDSREATIHFVSGSPLPCGLLAACWPAASYLGKLCTFDGRATFVQRGADERLDLVGRFERMDLSALLATYPHRLTGIARAELSRVVVKNGRLESAAGKLVAGPGALSRSLVHAAEANLHVEAAPQATYGRDNRLPYQELNIAFEIDGTGLVLRGEHAEAPRAMLVDSKQVLVRQPAAGRQPVVNLLRTLVPQTAVQVPATRETGGLAQFLPVPPIVDPPGSEQRLPQARTIGVAPK
jgi:hypothetical protein